MYGVMKMAKIGLTRAMLSTLMAFKGNEITSSQLSLVLGISQKQAWVRLKQLEERGLVKRVGRSVWRLTEEGRDIAEFYSRYEGMFKHAQELVDRVLEDLYGEGDPSLFGLKARIGIRIILNHILLIILSTLFKTSWYDSPKIRARIVKSIERDYLVPLIKCLQDLVSLRSSPINRLVLAEIDATVARTFELYDDYTFLLKGFRKRG